ncbi:MAG: HEPN domain-containing protein [Elusimicrobiota bacterium]
MAAKKTDIKKVASDRAGIYWDKAEDFFRTMRDASAAGNWNGAGLAAVHCAISAADAVLVAKAGVRSSSKDHEDAADLIASHVRHPQAKEQARRLRRILQEKNLIEYVDKSYRQDDALELQKHVERFMAWVRPHLNR